MLKNNENHQKKLNELLELRYPAVALKMVEDESVVPASALRPAEQTGRHIALCQAFALARRQGKTVYMRKQDHWCWNPLITYGAVECRRGTEPFKLISSLMGISDPDKADDFVDSFPKLPLGKYAGVLISPLDKADFKPDITLIYCKNDQLRLILMAVNSQTGEMLDSSFTALDSCVYSVIPPFLEGQYRITLPDPGEYERALTAEDDIIFTVPVQREEEFYKGVDFQLQKFSRGDFYFMMKDDFARPPFYNTLFEAWGLDTGEDWDK